MHVCGVRKYIPFLLASIFLALAQNVDLSLLLCFEALFWGHSCYALAHPLYEEGETHEDQTALSRGFAEVHFLRARPMVFARKPN